MRSRAPQGNPLSWLTSSNAWPTWARRPGTAWAVNCRLSNPSKSGQNRLAWIGQFARPRSAIGQAASNKTTRCSPSKTRRCSIAADTGSALSVVGDRYRVVQPREVLEFYRDLTDVFGYELETAGVLKGGRKLWALARTGQDAMLKNEDTVCSYLLLATSCDGTLATMATPTTVRVVCNNTLAVALKGANNAVKVPHSTTFDPMAVKKQLGIATSQWGAFLYRIQSMANRKVKTSEASTYFDNVLNLPSNLPAAVAPANGRALKRMQELFDGQGRGAELSTAKGTTWGLLNAVTEFVDHERRARSREYRLDSAWFGQGAAVKQRAFDLALDMVL